jgi:hypothetical protein
MSNSINSLLESAAGSWKNLQSDAVRMASKWSKTGLLEGLDNEVAKNNMAMILENQAKQLVIESNNTQIGGSTFTAGQGETWAGVALPLVRKVFGSLSTKEFMSVQPMNLPSGLVFFLDFQYGQGKEAPVSQFGPAGDVYNSQSSMYGNTNPANGADPSNGLYGAGRFAYSINQFSASVSPVASGSATWAMVEYANELSASIAAGATYSYITVTGPTAAGRKFDEKGVRAFVLESGSFTNAEILPQYTTTNGTTITFVYNKPNTFLATGSTGSLYYNVQTADNYRGDFEDASGAGYTNAESTSVDQLAIPSIDIKMKSEAIVAKTRKLKAQWTPEFAQDLNAYQSLDAEAELTSIMSEYIALEIDLENKGKIPGFASSSDGDVTKASYAFGIQKAGQMNNRYTVYKNPYMTENVILMGYRGAQFLETGAVFAPYVPLIMTPLVYDPETFTPRKGLLTRYAKKMIRPEFFGRIFINDLNVL